MHHGRVITVSRGILACYHVKYETALANRMRNLYGRGVARETFRFNDCGDPCPNRPEASRTLWFLT